MSGKVFATTIYRNMFFFSVFLLTLLSQCPYTYSQLYYTEPIINTDSLENELEKAGANDSIQILNRLAFAIRITDPARSLMFARQSYEIAIRGADKKLLMECNYHLGLAYHHNGDFASSIRYSLVALEMKKEWGNFDDYVPYVSLVVLSYFYSGNYDLAIQYVLVDDILLNINHFQDPFNRFDLFIRIGWVYKLAGLYQEAKPYFLKCVLIGNESNKIPPAHQCLNYAHLEHIYYQLNNYDSALFFARASHKLREENEFNAIPSPYHDIAESFQGLNHLDSAIIYYKRSIEFTDRIGAVAQNAGSCWSLGEIYLEMGDKEKSIKLFKKVTINGKWMVDHLRFFTDPQTNFEYWYSAEQIVSPYYKVVGYTYMARAYKALSEIYRQQGKFDMAYESLTRYIDTKSELEKLDRQAAVLALNIKYEVEKKEQQFLMLQKEAELQSSQASRSINLLVILVLVSVMVGLILIIYNRNLSLKADKEKSKLQQKLFRSQMNPHFIFNSLASIQNSIINEDSLKASKYLARFSKLVRNILDSSVEEYISLEEELITIDNYLALQKIRFPEKFDYTIEVDDKLDQANILIPPMLAQPFIENSIEHGFKNKEGKGKMKIRFALIGNLIHFELEDNGIGREKAKQLLQSKNNNHRSMSTDISRERLKVLNKKTSQKISLSIDDLKDENGSPAGTKVIFDIPYKN